MVLLDTHTLIWYMFDSSKLSEAASDRIRDEEKVYYSMVSLWEISIKQNIGKLDLDCSMVELAEKCEEAGLTILNIIPEHVEGIKNLPDHHNDPFDRLLIAQASIERLGFVTKDTTIPLYDIETIW